MPGLRCARNSTLPAGPRSGERISPHTPHPKMFLYSIDVFEEFRRQGIASILIQNLKEMAVSLKCREMFVPTSKNNTAAIALYTETGGKAQDNGVTFSYDEGALGT